jgi:hypothetical protein
MEHNTQIFITKFAHEHLPTRKHMKRIGEAETDKCPACQHTIETAWHILSCEKRHKWRQQLVKALTDLIEHINTQPDIALILIQGVRGALSNPEFQMNTEHRETRFRYLIEAQNQIGWQHLMKGRCSHHWIQIQQYHIQLDPDINEKKQSGDTWLKRVLHSIWTSLWQGWLMRNDDLHGRDRPQREQKRMEKLKPKVTALYAQVGSLLAEDKVLFDVPIQTKLKLSSGELESWIKLVTPTVKRATKDAMDLLQ